MPDIGTPDPCRVSCNKTSKKPSHLNTSGITDASCRVHNCNWALGTVFYTDDLKGHTKMYVHALAKNIQNIDTK